MSFSDILQEALEQVRGAQLVGMISVDGLGVELAAVDGSDTANAAMELGEVAAAISGASQRLSSGQVRDFMLEAEQAIYVASQVMPGYYAVIAVGPQSHLGRVRFAVKQMAQRLQSEL